MKWLWESKDRRHYCRPRHTLSQLAVTPLRTYRAVKSFIHFQGGVHRICVCVWERERVSACMCVSVRQNACACVVCCLFSGALTKFQTNVKKEKKWTRDTLRFLNAASVCVYPYKFMCTCTGMLSIGMFLYVCILVCMCVLTNKSSLVNGWRRPSVWLVETLSFVALNSASKELRSAVCEGHELLKEPFWSLSLSLSHVQIWRFYGIGLHNEAFLKVSSPSIYRDSSLFISFILEGSPVGGWLFCSVNGCLPVEGCTYP